LAAKNAQFDLGHIEPTAMLGCEVQLQSVQDAAGFSWLKGYYSAMLSDNSAAKKDGMKGVPIKAR
jgi:hypothetical protein